MTHQATGNDAAGNDIKKNVLICDTQPVAVEGMKWLIENAGDLSFAGAVPTLDAVYDRLCPAAVTLSPDTEDAVEIVEIISDAAISDAVISGAVISGAVTDGAVTDALVELSADGAGVDPVPGAPPVAPAADRIDAVLIDKGFGLAGVMELLQRLTATSHPTPAIVWGSSVSESEALRLLQAGARGILRRSSESGTLLICLRAVTSGGTWMEDGIFGSTEKLFNPRRSQLTQRESEVVVLVEKGLRNRDIARMLGIQTGTVKIHLKHIFEKTGVRGRYGLAFTGLQNKGSITMSSPPQFHA